jgi:glutathione S-transferase
MLKIWGRRNSLNTQKVQWCLAELGVAYEHCNAGLDFGQNDQPSYLAKNPNGLVPLLEDGSFSLWESNTIVRYLCALHARGTLWPEHPAERANAERWMDWQLSTLAHPLSVVYKNLIRTREAERDTAAVAQAHARVTRALAILDAHLRTQHYVAGAAFTMGDIPIGALIHRWLAIPGIERPEWPALRDWYGRLGERESYRRAVIHTPLT